MYDQRMYNRRIDDRRINDQQINDRQKAAQDSYSHQKMAQDLINVRIYRRINENDVRFNDRIL